MDFQRFDKGDIKVIGNFVLMKFSELILSSSGLDSFK